MLYMNTCNSFQPKSSSIYKRYCDQIYVYMIKVMWKDFLYILWAITEAFIGLIEELKVETTDWARAIPRPLSYKLQTGPEPLSSPYHYQHE